MKYTPLHLHTNFSKDGLGTIPALFENAKRIGFDSLAITDHGTLAGAVQFWSAAKAAGIKPIFGVEAYLDWSGKRGHLTILSYNKQGFDNLIALNNLAHTNLQKGFPVTTMQMLEQCNSGLLVLTGCTASPLYYGTEADGLQFAGTLYDIFGKDRMFAEVMGVIAEDNVTRPKMVARKLGIGTVVTTDSHFVLKSQAAAHLIMSQCRNGYDYNSGELYLKTPQELLTTSFLRSFSSEQEILGYMKNTMGVADMVEEIDLSAPPTLPVVTKGVDSLYDLARAASFSAEEKSRMETEISVVEALGLYDYFAILYDIVKFCKKNRIKVGPGRGSGGGSLFLYKLGITDVDPIEHGLLFERFLSLSRKDMADFDLDVEAGRRDEVIEYARQKWEALPIANFATYSNASLIRDLGRIFSVPKEVVERAADSDGSDLTEFFAYCGKSTRFTQEDARIAYDTMLGQVRHKGKHAGGVVVCTRPVPVEGGVVSWTEGTNRELSTVGLVKYDILGVTALSMVAEMEQLTGVTPGSPWDKDSGPVFDLFCNCDLAGIFQFSGSDGIVKLTGQVQPRTLADLSAINALYRPGPLDSGMAWEYPKAKTNPRLLHAEIDKILQDSYGVIIYQEQVMQIVALVTGGSLEEADNVRKIISKGKVGDVKWQAKMRDLEAHFKEEGYKVFAKAIVDQLWSEIVTFGRYGFNKSHSTAYSLLAYRMAWFKVYYPGAFYTALLNNDSEKVEVWVYDAAKHGISVVKPHINESGVKWVWNKTEDTIFAPLSVVKWFGETGAQAVVEYRQIHGNFVSYESVAKVPKKKLNSRAKKLLYYAEAFRGLEGDPGALIEDFVDLPILSDVEAQRESIGFVIPTKKILGFMDNQNKAGRSCGFVSDIEVRNKGRGDYFVVHLSPSGSFWSKDPAVGRLKKGDLITVQAGARGATDIKKARL